jgi:hypothetical protein
LAQAWSEERRGVEKEKPSLGRVWSKLLKETSDGIAKA